MSSEFEILSVQQQGDTVLAVLPVSKVLGQELGAALDADFDRLAFLLCQRVILDFRQVEFIDGAFFSRLLRLHRRLKESSVQLSLCFSNALNEIVALLRLDRALEIINDVDAT